MIKQAAEKIQVNLHSCNDKLVHFHLVAQKAARLASLNCYVVLELTLSPASNWRYFSKVLRLPSLS